MDDKQVKFLPFHSINEFMLDDYRNKVLQNVFANQASLSGDRRNSINGMVKKMVSVAGFRNSAQAPAPMKVRGATKPFTRSPEFTAQILQAWSELHPELRQKIFDLLKAREWDILPADADRTKLPGFMIDWPKDETYDTLDAAFAETYPGAEDVADDIRLMVVWIGNRLPYNMSQDDEEAETGEEQA
jgi:hypothetical protein